MNVKHTPTPWELGDSPMGGNGFCTIDAVDPTDGVGFIVCEVYGIDHSRIPCPTSEANAAMIVKAVNAHDSLVDAVKMLLGCMHVAGWECDPAAVKARAALAAAGEPV